MITGVNGEARRPSSHRCIMADPAPSPGQFVKPRFFETRVSLLYASIFVPVGFHLPYFPLWLENHGLNAEEIALVLSLPLFLRLVTTPVITALADKLPERANVLIAMVALTAAMALGYLLPPTYAFVLALSVAIQIVWTPHAPLTDSLALSGVRRFGCNYAGMRKWGSASFVLANLAGGVIVGHWGADAVPVIIVGGLLGTFIVSLGAPRLGRPRRASPLSAAAMRDAPGLFTRSFVVIIAAAGVINSSHGLLFSFGTIYWRGAGIGETTIGFLWAFMVLCEIALLVASHRFFGNLSPQRLLAMAGFAAMLRWALFPLIDMAGAGVAGFFVVQALHGFSTGFLLVGVPKMLAETVGEERLGAAQGAVFFANGLALALVMFASGWIYSALGMDGFYVMSGVAMAGTALLVFVSPRGRGQEARPPSRDR